jgi:hypothetical protein
MRAAARRDNSEEYFMGTRFLNGICSAEYEHGQDKAVVWLRESFLELPYIFTLTAAECHGDKWTARSETGTLEGFAFTKSSSCG